MIGVAAIIKALAQLAWPMVVVALGWIFRTALGSFLASFENRDLSLKTPAFEANVVARVQHQSEQPPAEKIGIEASAPEPSTRPALNILEARFRADTEALEPGKREGALLRALATSRLEGAHEFHYNRIFGSQIAALKRLNEIGSATVENARAFFEPYAKLYPALYDNYGFTGWLSYLVDSGLITRTGDQLEISEFGRDFLIYLTEKRLLEMKLY